MASRRRKPPQDSDRPRPICIDDCFICTMLDADGRPVRRATGLYQIVANGGFPYGRRPMSLCRRCALDWGGQRLPLKGSYPVQIGPIPPRITRATVAAALRALEMGANLPTEPCGWDLWRERERRESDGQAPRWGNNGPDLPGDEWKRGGK